MRIMGLDVGKRRIGIAISDELGITAQALTTLEKGRFEEILKTIRALAQKYEVKEIVVGLPRHMNGDLGKEGDEIVNFGKTLGKELGISVVFWDERLSTVAAERALLAGDVSRVKRRKVIDKIAASWILGGYLNWRLRGPGEGSK